MLSVIIPVYKAEGYIENCIKGVLSQTFLDYELLLVLDGSFDKSEEICRKYAAEDSRIRVIMKEHSGVAATRQVGLDNAQGEYVLFVDADDAIVPTCFEEVMACAMANDADIVVFDYDEVSNTDTTHHKQQPTALDGTVMLNDILGARLYGALWNKLIRRECITRSGVRFDARLTMREDMVFFVGLLPTVKRVAYLPKSLYRYDRRNNGSLTNNFLDDSKQNFEQDVLGYFLTLQSKYINPDVQKSYVEYYHELAYITLRSDLMTRAEWNDYFLPYADEMTAISRNMGYKGALVRMALNGHFVTAQVLRTIIFKMR